jgi:hypothetical protein
MLVLKGALAAAEVEPGGLTGMVDVMCTVTAN